MIDTKNFRHSDLGVYSAEASDLGLAPGEWPAAFVVHVGEKTYVAGKPVVQRDREGDVLKVTYFAIGACFVIWND